MEGLIFGILRYQIFLYAKPFALVGRHGIMVFRPENLKEY